MLIGHRQALTLPSLYQERHIELGIISQAQQWTKHVTPWGLHLRAQAVCYNPILQTWMSETPTPLK